MLRSHLLAATILAALAVSARTASAQPISGLYIGAAGGANFLLHEQVRIAPPGAGPRAYGRNSFETGWVALGNIGWGFGNGLRLELEGNYRHNRVSDHGGSIASLGGREEKWGPMVNVLFDLDVGSPYVFPYIGAGAGYQWVQEHGAFSSVLGRSAVSDREGSFAYQAIAGLSFPIPPVVGLSFLLEYRYLQLTGARGFPAITIGGPGAGPSEVKTRADFNHGVLAGLRYAFNVAPPPAPAAATVTAPPAAEAARTYLVFFDWDSAALTDRARQVIADAAQATTRTQVTRIEVNGFTDTSGTARYNQGLSVRRAQAVANELVRLGVPRQAISTQGFGETRLLVPTADGVREPQNRRVEIILR